MATPRTALPCSASHGASSPREDRAVQLDAGRDGGLLGLLGARVDGQQTLAQRGVTDLQGVQDHGERRAVVRSALQVGDRLRQLDVAHHLGEAAVELDRLQVIAEVLPGLALDLLGALDEVGERTELVDPLRGGLLTDAGDAREVVRRVTAQRREVGVLAGREAVLLGDLLRREARQLRDALGRVEHGDVVGDQLEGVAVTGDDQDLEAGRLRLGGERRDDIVRLIAVHGEAHRVHRVEHLADQLDLALELVRRLGAVRLVVGELLGAPRLARDVEGHREVRGRLVTQGVRQHRREAVDRVRRLARGGREILRGQREERPVRQGVPVHEEQARALLTARLRGLGRHGLGLLLRCCFCHVPDPATPH